MALGDMKTDSVQFTSKASVRDLGIRLQQICANLRANTRRLQTDDAFGVTEAPDIGVLAEGKKFMGGAWAVQILVYDRGNDRFVELIALGDSGFTKFQASMAGDRGYLRESPSLGTSRKIRDQIANSLV